MKLKKFIAIILTTITAACVAVGFSGCKDEITLPPMTETAPVVATRQNMDCYKEIEKDENHTSKTKYECFEEYYNGEFRQICEDKFYYINLTRVEPEQQKWFSIIGDFIMIMVEKDSETQTSLVNPVIYQNFEVYDYYVGDSRDNGSIAPWTLDFNAYMLPVQGELPIEEMTLKFGKNNDRTHIPRDYYINIYLGETCIGTCYFDTNVSISYEWFEDFFTRHLVYGG